MERGIICTVLLFLYTKTISGKSLLKVRFKLCKYLLEQMDCLSVFAQIFLVLSPRVFDYEFHCGVATSQILVLSHFDPTLQAFSSLSINNSNERFFVFHMSNV